MPDIDIERVQNILSKCIFNLLKLGLKLPVPAIEVVSTEDILAVATAVVPHKFIAYRATGRAGLVKSRYTNDRFWALIEPYVLDIVNTLKYTTKLQVSAFAILYADDEVLEHILLHELLHTVTTVVIRDVKDVLLNIKDPTEGHHKEWLAVAAKVSKALNLKDPIRQMAYPHHIEAIIQNILSSEDEDEEQE